MTMHVGKTVNSVASQITLQNAVGKRRGRHNKHHHHPNQKGGQYSKRASPRQRKFTKSR